VAKQANNGVSPSHESAALTYSPQDAVEARKEIFDRLLNYPATPEEHERSLGLFLRGSLLARIMATAEIYKRIVHLPGVILDIGTWRGQTAILCENFRAIYEPLNFNRRIIAFDTFEGYLGFNPDDRAKTTHDNGTYSVGGEGYAKYLAELLVMHERSNAMGHNNGKHSVIAGDVRVTIPEFFARRPNECVSLAFFDVNAFEPTAKAFEEIETRLVPGGIAAFWQMTRESISGEGRTYNEHILPKLKHRVERSDTYPGLCFITKEQ
jgi:hypothetical protein